MQVQDLLQGVERVNTAEDRRENVGWVKQVEIGTGYTVQYVQDFLAFSHLPWQQAIVDTAGSETTHTATLNDCSASV